MARMSPYLGRVLLGLLLWPFVLLGWLIYRLLVG